MCRLPIRAALLGGIGALALVVPATADVAGDAHVSGQYRVVYFKVAGQDPRAPGQRVWAVVPTCAVGGCSLRIRSRAGGEKAGYPLLFHFDGTTYENGGSSKGEAACIRPDGTVIVDRAYDGAWRSRFQVTLMSPSGRALVFKGTYSAQYTLNARGQGHDCRPHYWDTERYTGYPVTQ